MNIQNGKEEEVFNVILFGDPELGPIELLESSLDKMTLKVLYE
jgi:hypothetical protein